MLGFIDLLPFDNPEELVQPPVGHTPCCNLSVFEKNKERIHFKLENYNPSGSFYDRAFTAAVTVGKEAGFKQAAAAVFEAEELKSLVFCGSSCRMEIFIFTYIELAEKFSAFNKLENINIIGVDTISRQNLFDCACKYIEKEGFYNCSLHYNPYSRDGLKTLTFEIFLQFKKLPAYIFLPSGRGTLISAVYRGFEELKTLGWDKTIPRIISGEPAREAFLAACHQKGEELSENFQAGKESTMIDNLFAPRALAESGGDALVLSEQELERAQQLLASKAGLGCSYRGSAGLGAYLQLKDTIDTEDNIVIVIDSNKQPEDFLNPPEEFPTIKTVDQPDSIADILNPNNS